MQAFFASPELSSNRSQESSRVFRTGPQEGPPFHPLAPAPRYDFALVVKRRTYSDGDRTEATMTTCTVTTAASSVRSDSSTIHSCGSSPVYYLQEQEMLQKKREQFQSINNAILARRRQQELLQKQQQQLPVPKDQFKQHLSSPSRALRMRTSTPGKHQSQISKQELASSASSLSSSFHSRAAGTVSTKSSARSQAAVSVSAISHVTPQSCPAKLSLKKNRRVHFVPDDEDGEPVTKEFPGMAALTAEEKTAMWWQPVDYKLFRRYCKRAAELARQSQYTDAFTAVYDACSGKHIHDMMEFCHISRSHVRGLEIVVFPALIQARKLVVRGVVNAQDKLPEEMNPDQRAKILSATSRCLSGRARLLARVYGVGDEEVAKDCYYSMEKDGQEASA